ncbi:hypothetical protein RIF29_35435 [Crotalaria pallida]|uniref:AT-hook motif nuclear-localized protein n=1 Tax=Crotalaria pallida TaxID=3830 RepID=A0AAN9E9X8_CROPI
MDSREPPRQPPPPPSSSSSSMMMGPTSYASTNHHLLSPNSSMLAPATARFPFSSSSSHHHHPPQPVSLPPPSVSSPMIHSSEPFSTTTSPYDGSSNSSALAAPSASEPVKKKRGRPRKYPSDGDIALGLAPTAAAHGGGANGRGDSGGMPSSDAPPKKHRGRPPGSGKKQLDALGAGGVGFTPHVIQVDPGEDIAEKVMAFTQQGPRTVCILSVYGAVCNVTLRHPELSGGTATYKIIVGSFVENGKKSSSKKVLKSGPSSAPASQMLTFGGSMTPTSPTSQGPSTESSAENDHSPPPFRGPGHYNNASQLVNNNMQMYHPLWASHTHHH